MNTQSKISIKIIILGLFFNLQHAFLLLGQEDSIKENEIKIIIDYLKKNENKEFLVSNRVIEYNLVFLDVTEILKKNYKIEIKRKKDYKKNKAIISNLQDSLHRYNRKLNSEMPNGGCFDFNSFGDENSNLILFFSRPYEGMVYCELRNKYSSYSEGRVYDGFMVGKVKSFLFEFDNQGEMMSIFHGLYYMD